MENKPNHIIRSYLRLKNLLLKSPRLRQFLTNKKMSKNIFQLINKSIYQKPLHEAKIYNIFKRHFKYQYSNPEINFGCTPCLINTYHDYETIVEEITTTKQLLKFLETIFYLSSSKDEWFYESCYKLIWDCKKKHKNIHMPTIHKYMDEVLAYLNLDPISKYVYKHNKYTFNYPPTIEVTCNNDQSKIYFELQKYYIKCFWGRKTIEYTEPFNANNTDIEANNTEYTKNFHTDTNSLTQVS